MSKVQKVLDYLALYINKPDFNEMHYMYLMHMHGVADFASMIALRRGLDSEIAIISALLHDIHTLTTLDSAKHAKRGAVLARKILSELNIVNRQELDIICSAIHNHSNKKDVHSPYDELLKDADVLHHCLYDTSFPPSQKDKKRFKSLAKEFSLSNPKY